MRSKPPVETDTASKQRILDSAIALFAAKGVDNVSLRELTTRAEVNLAAVNYHFGTKEALAEIVFDELSLRVNKRRLNDLRAMLEEAAKTKKSPRLEDIIDAFISPYVGEPQGVEQGLMAHLLLMHRMSPSAMTTRVIRKHFDPMAREYVQALVAACPGLDLPELYWRYSYMTGALVFTAADRRPGNRLARLSRGVADPADLEQFRVSFVRFMVAALRPG